MNVVLPSPDQQLMAAQWVLAWLIVEHLYPQDWNPRLGSVPPAFPRWVAKLAVYLGITWLLMPVPWGPLLGLSALAATHGMRLPEPKSLLARAYRPLILVLLYLLLPVLALWASRAAGPLGFALNLPLTADALTGALLAACGPLLLFRPAGLIVKAVLDLGGVIPSNGQSASYRAGGYIGYLERLGIFAFVLSGHPEAAGFVIAAKGLVRGKELENREFTEYFLLGTLTSVMLAAGIAYLVKFLTGW